MADLRYRTIAKITPIRYIEVITRFIIFARRPIPVENVIYPIQQAVARKIAPSETRIPKVYSTGQNCNPIEMRAMKNGCSIQPKIYIASAAANATKMVTSGYREELTTF